jgi:hypothetical protein
MKLHPTFLVAGVLLCPLISLAGPADYVYTPSVTYGEREIDFKMGSAEKAD